MNFINFLKRAKNARKVFGKKEIKIIARQLKGMKLTQSERNRLSRDIRPKLEFIEGCHYYKEFFKLEKNMVNKLVIEQSEKLILNDRDAKKIGPLMLLKLFFTLCSITNLFTIFFSSLKNSL